MTRNQLTPERNCGGDVAAYALGALEPAEAEAFRAHLETCTICRDELAVFQNVVGALPLAAPQYKAPRRLRRRVIREVRNEAVGARPDETRGRVAGPARLIRGRPALALSAALAVVVIAIGGIVVGNSGSARTRVYAAQVVGRGTAELRVTSGQGQLVVHHFAPPPRGKIYEVWLARPGKPPAPTSALFSVTNSGNGDVEVPGSLRGVAEVLVTPEPAGGSQVPTHAPVIKAELT